MVAVRGWLSSRLASLHEPGVQHHIPDMVPGQNPGEEPLQAHAIASVGTRPKLPLQQSKTIAMYLYTGRASSCENMVNPSSMPWLDLRGKHITSPGWLQAMHVQGEALGMLT